MLSGPSAKGVSEAGVDEVGRGCLFGPVVAAAVILGDDLRDARWAQVKDSKKLSEKKRVMLSEFIRNECVAYGIGVVSNKDIDSMNILKATYKAMNLALDDVYRRNAFERVVIDGPHFEGYLPPGDADVLSHTCIPNGDALVLSIACASIVAKTYRDAEMVNMDEDIVLRYGIRQNKGYGTKAHMDAIRQFGVTPYHRMSFRPCSEFALGHI